MKKDVRKAWVVSLTTMALLMAASMAMATTVPVVGDFSYSIYQYGIDEILKGPIGVTMGIGCMVWASMKAVQGAWMPAVGAVLGGVGFIKADDLVTSISGTLF